jgi:hypothetical protein
VNEREDRPPNNFSDLIEGPGDTQDLTGRFQPSPPPSWRLIGPLIVIVVVVLMVAAVWATYYYTRTQLG